MTPKQHPARPSHPFPQTILAIDDEPTVLSALARLFRPDGIEVLTAANGEEGLSILEKEAERIGVVVCDYAMPGMTGAEVLRTVLFRWPDISRVLLTGNADLKAAAQAVNEGQLSRLYTKPWHPDEFRHAIAQALEQRRVVQENRRLRTLADEQAARLEQWNQRLEALVSERTAELERANESLKRGLLDTVRLLLNLLEQRQPERAAECRTIARLAGRLATRAGLSAEDARMVQVAALVHDIGTVGLPDHLLRTAPESMPPAARIQYQKHPIVGEAMLGGVVQLQQLGLWIRHHHERWDGRGYPDRLAGPTIPLPAQIIGLADAYLQAAPRTLGATAAWLRAQQRGGTFNPELLVLLECEVSDGGIETTDVGIPMVDLQEGMVLREPLRTAAGAVLLYPGEPLTSEHVERIRRFLAEGTLAGQLVLVEELRASASNSQPMPRTDSRARAAGDRERRRRTRGPAAA